MNWRKSLEGALVAAGASAFAAAPPLYMDGTLSRAELWSLFFTFGSVFFAYLCQHQPKDVPSAE